MSLSSKKSAADKGFLFRVVPLIFGCVLPVLFVAPAPNTSLLGDRLRGPLFDFAPLAGTIPHARSHHILLQWL
tara:strand:+ start:410 stop:628 length:219 start_codon:yes stop_codon:yes gene_type:complete